MKIRIVGSITFSEQMKKVKEQLQSLGHVVVLPSSVEKNQTKEYWENLKIRDPDEFVKVGIARNMKYFEEIRDADAILVINLKKNENDNYIGISTFMSMTVAFEHGKKIFLMNDLTKNFFAEEEVGYMRPIVINSDLSKVK